MRKEDIIFSRVLHETLIEKFAKPEVSWVPLKIEGYKGTYVITIDYKPYNDEIRLYAHIIDPDGYRATVISIIKMTGCDECDDPDEYIEKSNPRYRHAVYDLADDIIAHIDKSDRLSVSDEYTKCVTTIADEAKIVGDAGELIRGYAGLLAHAEIEDHSDPNKGQWIDDQAENIDDILKFARHALDEIEGYIDYITELTAIVKS